MCISLSLALVGLDIQVGKEGSRVGFLMGSLLLARRSGKIVYHWDLEIWSVGMTIQAK